MMSAHSAPLPPCRCGTASRPDGRNPPAAREQGRRVDMISDTDEPGHPPPEVQPPEAASMRQQFPLACDTAGCTASVSGAVVVLAQKASVPVSAHRGLPDFALDDRLLGLLPNGGAGAPGAAGPASTDFASAPPSEWDGRNPYIREAPDALQARRRARDRGRAGMRGWPALLTEPR